MSAKNDSVNIGSDGVARCWWCGDDPLYVAYHDHEWGRTVDDDRTLFEMLTLDVFQAGLSWFIILQKREAFRNAFAGFDYEKVARFTSRDVTRLLSNSEIVRNRMKIEATIANAAAFPAVIDEFGSFARYLDQFALDPRTRPSRITRTTLPAQSPESVACSKDLKKRGFKFVGPVGVYAFMQSVGLVNDHVHGCAFRD